MQQIIANYKKHFIQETLVSNSQRTTLTRNRFRYEFPVFFNSQHPLIPTLKGPKNTAIFVLVVSLCVDT